jgi:DNA-binding MurR/RpiR family transcriptional regulator
MTTMPHQRETRSIRHQVEDGLSDLSKKQRQVAESFLASPTSFLFATAAQVAEQARVDPATVVRFAQSFDFSGYAEFQEALRAESPVLRTTLDRLQETDAEETGDGAALVDRVRAQTLANLERSFAQLAPAQFEAALDYLLAARRVIVVGAGQSHVLALHLHRALQTAQIDSQLLGDWYDFLFDAANVGAEDVLFGVTVWKYSRMTVEAVRFAKSVGAPTLLLTDATYAPGAESADVTLLFEWQALGEYMSPAAGAAIIDCLAAGLAARVPERVKRSMALQFELGAASGIAYR